MKPVPPAVGRLLLGLSLVFAVGLVTAWAAARAAWIGPSATGCLLSLALAASVTAKLRNVTFTLWIATGVALGMSFPSWFLGVGDFKFTSLFVPILQVIMFGMGTTLSVTDFARVFKMPAGILAGVACQFTIMPVIGFFLAHAFGFPPEIAAGLVLVGVSPSGLASNVMAYIAKANLAMSVTMTAASTLLAPIMTPLLMRLLAGEMIEIDVPAMMWSITKIVLLPVLGGLVFHHLFYHRFKWLDRVMPMISMVGIFIMTVLTVATGRDNLLQMGALLIIACFLHCVAGFVLGYWACRLLGMSKLTCRTISLEVGLQNSGMASGIAAELNKVATLGLAPIVFGPVMNITASTIANWWRTHAVELTDRSSTATQSTETTMSEDIKA
jgi:BASS family bile acid:Na+ symporter